MPRKLTYEYVYNYFKENGCELLETEYINNRTRMKYKCKCGNISEIRFNDFKNGNRCFKCSGSKKHTQEFVDDFIKNEGWINKSIYKNAHTKLKLICPNGHVQYKKFNDFYTNNRRCNICAGLEKHTQEFVDDFIKNEGWINNSLYLNNITKLELICPNGHLQYKTFGSFQQGYRCRKCYFENRRKEIFKKYDYNKSRKKRAQFLQFSLYNINILKEDLNYNDYLNNKKIYNIDHIYPSLAFIDNDFDKIYDIKIIKEICNSVDNLRIITKKENLLKNKKYNQDEFINWFNNKLNEMDVKICHTV